VHEADALSRSFLKVRIVVMKHRAKTKRRIWPAHVANLHPDLAEP